MNELSKNGIFDADFAVPSKHETIHLRGTITRVVPLIVDVDYSFVEHWTKHEAIGLRSDEGQEVFIFLADLPFDKQWYDSRVGKMIDVVVDVREVEMKLASDAPKLLSKAEKKHRRKQLKGTP